MKAVVLCLILLAPLTVWAGGSAEPTREAAVPKVVEIRVGWFGNQARHTMINAMLDKFEAKNPNIKTTREFAATDDYWRRLTTQAAGRNAPDIYVMQFHAFDYYAHKGQLMDLDKLVKSSIIDLRDFYPTHIENGKVDGRIYGVSLGGSIRGLFYNTAIFARAGVPAPKEGWTWEDDFVATCKALKKAVNNDDFWAIEDFSGSNDAFFTYVRGKGYDFFKEAKLGFPKSELQSWFELSADLRKAGAIPPAQVMTERGGKAQPESLFGKGNVAMQMKPTNQLPLYQKVTKDELDVFSLPSRKGGKNGDFIGSTNWVMASYCKYPEQAGRVINYFVNDFEAIDLWKIELGPLPSKRTSEYIMPKLSASEKKLVVWTEKTLPRCATVVGFPEGGNEVYSDLVGQIADKIAHGKLTIEKGVDEYFNNAEQALSSMR